MCCVVFDTLLLVETYRLEMSKRKNVKYITALIHPAANCAVEFAVTACSLSNMNISIVKGDPSLKS